MTDDEWHFLDIVNGPFAGIADLGNMLSESEWTKQKIQRLARSLERKGLLTVCPTNSDTPDPWIYETTEINEEHPCFSEFLQRACVDIGRVAREKAFAAGRPVVYMKDGNLVHEYPDGTIKEIEQ